MYDPLTSTYRFGCPTGKPARVRLSDLRVLERIPGAAHPAVYAVRFSCSCGDEHAGLLSHDDLDVAPLGVNVGGTFRNLLTSRDDILAIELAEIAAARIGAGEWPWSFFCFLEARPRPITPSAFAVIAPGGRSLGVAVRCPWCSSVSVNLVTHEHLDVPFWNDERIGVVDHVFAEDALRAVEEFRAELESSRFDERRMDLER
jgi:hypothetical protein